MVKMCVFTIILWLPMWTSVSGLVCLSCNGVAQPRHCHQVEECKLNQYCSVERVFNNFNEVLYNVGCTSPRTCLANSSTGLTDACLECCNGDLCNSKGCATPGYPSQGGPICFNCTSLQKGRLCHRIDACTIDEVCYTEEVEEFGDVFVNSGCKASTSCHGHGHVGTGNMNQGIVIGKRSRTKKSVVTQVCSHCCHTSLCNDGCSYTLCNDSWHNCSYLSHHYGICTDGILSKYCPSTCGKCGSQVTTPPPVTVSGNNCSDSNDKCRLLDESIALCKDAKLAIEIGCLSTCHLCGEVVSTTEIAQLTSPPGTLATDCLEIHSRTPGAPSGVYNVTVYHNHTIRVWCDMVTDGGGWTVFQKRFDGSVDFYQNFSAYKHGFGNISGEFWLGLENIYALTEGRSNTIRVDVTDIHKKQTYETMSIFNIGPSPYYKLNVDGHSGGNVSSRQLYRFDDDNFSTFDMDQDIYSDNCAVMFHGGFWYHNCIGLANPNGLYKPGGSQFDMSYSTPQGNTAMQMKFRRNVL